MTITKTIWPCCKQALPPTNEVTSRRRRAFIQFCVMYIVASLLVILFKLDHLWLALFLYLLGMVVLIGGYFIPPLFNAFEKFGKMLGRSVGAGMTYALLVPFFYLCFLPGRLILNARGKDPMRRRWNPESKTYWIDKPKDEDAGRYTRQY